MSVEPQATGTIRGRSLPPAAVERLEKLSWVLFLGLFVFSFTQADRWLEKSGALPSRPSIIFILVMVPLAAAAVYRSWKGPDRGLATVWLLRASLPVAMPFAALAAAALLWSLHPTANWRDGGVYVLLLPFDFVVFGLSLLVGSLEPVRRRIPLLGMLAGGVLVATILADALLPGSFSSQASRAAGLAENANVSAFLTLSAACLVLTFGRSRWRDLLVLGVAGVAVLLTFSRAGLLLMAALWVVYAAVVFSSQRGSRLRQLVPVAVAVALLAGGLLLARRLVDLEVGLFSRSVAQDRVDMLTDPGAFIEDAGDGDSRVGLVRAYALLIGDAPFLGHGTGYSYGRSLGPHNRFLQSWTNLGLPGLLAYSALLLGAFVASLAARYWPGVAYSLLLAGWSFFSHGVLEQRSVPMMLGLVAAVVALGRPEEPGELESLAPAMPHAAS